MTNEKIDYGRLGRAEERSGNDQEEGKEKRKAELNDCMALLRGRK